MGDSSQDIGYLEPLSIPADGLPLFEDTIGKAVGKGITKAHLTFYAELQHVRPTREVFDERHPEQVALIPSMVLRARYVFSDSPAPVDEQPRHDMPVSGLCYLDPQNDKGLVGIVADAHADSAVKVYESMQQVQSKGIALASNRDLTLISRTILHFHAEKYYGARQTVHDAVEVYLENALKRNSLPDPLSRNYGVLHELGKLERIR